MRAARGQVQHAPWLRHWKATSRSSRREQRNWRGDGPSAGRARREVALAARRKERLDALADEIGGVSIQADVTDRDQALAAVERTASELDRLDIVINNVGADVARPDRRRAHRGVGADGRAQRARG